MRSAGKRSGVNCTRANFAWMAAQMVRTVSVFASPGTPSRSTWPPVNRPTRMRSIMYDWPTMTLPISARRSSTKALSLATSSLSARTSCMIFLGSRQALLARWARGRQLRNRAYSEENRWESFAPAGLARCSAGRARFAPVHRLFDAREATEAFDDQRLRKQAERARRAAERETEQRAPGAGEMHG